MNIISQQPIQPFNTPYGGSVLLRMIQTPAINRDVSPITADGAFKVPLPRRPTINLASRPIFVAPKAQNAELHKANIQKLMAYKAFLYKQAMLAK